MSTLSQPAAPLAATPETPAHEPIRIYVACLAAYNSGILHGRWIEASEGETHIWEETRAMLAASPVPDAEEWAIHDYEGFEGASLHAYASFKTVCALAEFIAEHGALGAKLYCHFGEYLDEARAAFDDYAGSFRSAAEFAEQLHEDAGTTIPDSLRYYIDWNALARDMVLNGDIFTIETGFEDVHVFWSR